MANMTASTITAYNTATAVTFYGAQATHEVDLDEKADEKCLLIITNTNTNAAMTATVTIAPTDAFLQNVGTLTVNIPGASAYRVIGPLEGAKYKNSASKLSIATAVTASGTVSYVQHAVVHSR